MDELFSVISCAWNSADLHIAEKPVLLSCGHSICKKCLPQELNYMEIKCALCGKLNRHDFTKIEDYTAFNLLIKEHLHDLFSYMVRKLSKLIQNCVDKVTNIEEFVKCQVEYAKEEIEIRVESMKNELDNYCKSLYDELDEIKLNWKNAEFNDEKVFKYDSDYFEGELEKLSKFTQMQKDLNENALYACQKKVKEMSSLFVELDSVQPSIKFIVDEVDLSKYSLGKIYYNFDNLDYRSIKDRLNSSQFTCVNIDAGYGAYDLCVLSDGSLLIANYGGSNLMLYNQNMNLVTTIDNINDLTFRPISLATDSKQQVYITDCDNHRIIKTDLTFKNFTLFGSGVGNKEHQLNKPFGICFTNSMLYVCDMNNKRIQKLDSNLSFKESYQLNQTPWYIKAVGNMACVRSYNTPVISFYDLNSFILKFQYNEHNGFIGTICSRFYEYYATNKTIYYYDQNGELLEEIKTTGFNNQIHNTYGGVYYFNGKLTICWYGASKLIFV